jgi:hypothetical protein
MKSLKVSFNPTDRTGRESVFVFDSDEGKEIYLRALVQNPSAKNCAAARVFLRKIELVSPAGETKLITSDMLALNWAMTSGAEVEFLPGYEHFVDIATFKLGDEAWTPMTTKKPAYWPDALKQEGTYRLHLILTGPEIKPQKAIFELRWPIKELSSDSYRFKLN